MKKQSNMISQNLTTLRHFHKYSQEEVAEKIGVTRQAVAKWEGGETVPDILNCDALAELYNVSVDDLIHFCLLYTSIILYDLLNEVCYCLNF